MSASDAAPLPRLGEVFFDVRGESRSMRLSWYADTGVAVFSIWQGGTCTGTFRLPIADLPRMVEALRHGPHGRDDPVAGEKPASQEPRLPAAPRPPAPALSSRPELLDSDIETGQTTAAIYLPSPESDLTGYQAEPPMPDYPSEPPGSYRDGPPADGPGYQAGPPPQPGYRGKAPRPRRGSPPAPEPAGGTAHRNSGGDLEGGQGGYAAEPPAPDFPGEYPAEPLAPDFPGEYPAEPLTPDFPGEYAAEPPAPDFPGDGHDEYPGDPLAPDLPREPSRGYSGRPAGRGPGGHRAPLEPGYPGEAAQGYPDEPDTAGYPGEPADGYLDGETLAAGYPGEYQDGGYQDGPPPGGYPDEQDYQHYPEELAATEYGSPARPYVTDTRSTDEPSADDPPGRRKPRGRRRAEPSPDSFPYGPPPTDDEPRPRGRYPGRH